MSTGPCDVKLSQDQRRFIKKSRQEEERINPDALLKECEQKLTAFFHHGWWKNYFRCAQYLKES